MPELRLVSESKHKIKPIIEAALENELRLIQAGIRQTERNLKKFEEKFQFNTRDFIAGYEDDKFEENLDYIEWVGEFRLLERLNEKADTLRSIRIAS